MHQTKLLIAAVVALAIVIGLLIWRRKEKFGGVIKKIRRIPFNQCRGICAQYYQRCLQDYSNADPHWCRSSFDACTAECYYSNHHRV